MIALLQKDFRVYRWAFIAAITAILAPYFLVIFLAFYNIVVGEGHRLDGIFDLFPILSLCACVAVAAIFGGSAFSVERRDRSAEFLAMVPVDRWQIICSKCLVPIPALLFVWFVITTFSIVTSFRNDFSGAIPRADNGNIAIVYALTSGTMIGVFGVAWLIGLFVNSPAISASAALMILFATGFFLRLQFPDVRLDSLLFPCSMVLGVGCFLLGIVFYVTRVSP